MVTSNGLQRFVARNNAGKYPLDVHEIRSGFLAAADVADRARAFHDERINQLRLGGPPLSVPWASGFVLHFIPVGSFASLGTVDLRKAYRSALLLALYPTGANLSFNIDGVIARGDDSYATLFRTGVLEAASAQLTRELIPSRTLVDAIVAALARYLKLASKLEIPAPVFIPASLFGVQGAKMAVPSGDTSTSFFECTFDRDVVGLPHVLVENLDASPSHVLRPMFDGLWQGAGMERCSYYDSDGRLSPAPIASRLI
jgi:hypothetical protein